MGSESKFTLGTACVEQPSWLPVGFVSIPSNFSPKACQVANEVSKVSNCDFLTRTQIDRVWLIVLFRRQEDSLGSILNIEEFPRSRPGTPSDNVLLLVCSSFNELPYERGNHMRGLIIKIVAWAIKVDREQVNGIESEFLAVS